MKGTGFNSLIVHNFQATGFKRQPAPLHLGAGHETSFRATGKLRYVYPCTLGKTIDGAAQMSAASGTFSMPNLTATFQWFCGVNNKTAAAWTTPTMIAKVRRRGLTHSGGLTPRVPERKRLCFTLSPLLID